MEKLGHQFKGAGFLNKVEVNEETGTVIVYIGFGTTKPDENGEVKSKGYFKARACKIFKRLIQEGNIEKGDRIKYDGFSTFNIDADNRLFENKQILNAFVETKNTEYKKKEGEEGL